MVIGYFFNRNGIVFVSGIAVDGRRVRTLELSKEEKEHWEEVLYPFHDKKIVLGQRITYGTSPRVAFHRHSDTGQGSLVIMAGDEGRRLAEVLLQFNPPMSSVPFIYHTGHPDAETITCQAMVLL